MAFTSRTDVLDALGARRKNFLLSSHGRSTNKALTMSVNGLCIHSLKSMIHKQLCLKAVATDIAQEARLMLIANCPESPFGRLCITIPRDIHRGAINVRQRHNRRVLIRQTGPVVAEGTIILHALAQRARVHVRMEHRGAVACKLRHGALRAPAHEHVAAGKDLRATLRLRKQVIRWKVRADELCGPGVGVQAQDLAAASRRGVHLGAAIVLGAMRAVVIQADDLDAIFLAEPARVVLEAELGAVGHFEVAAVAVEAPDDATVGAVDLVHGAGVAGRDEVVALGIFVDAVDVEVVPRIRRVVARAGLTWVDGQDGFVWGDVVEAGPLKQKLAGRNVKL